MLKVLNATAALCAGTTILGTLVVYNKYHVEPHITIKQDDDRIKVYMTGLTRSSVITEELRHSGLKCIENSGYQVVQQSSFKILPPKRKGIDPAFVFTSTSTGSEPSDVQLEQFRKTCVQCNVHTEFVYNDLWGTKQQSIKQWS